MALRPLSVGWHGKLPSRGDFVGRGLPRGWLRPWDDWLQRGLVIAARRWGPQLREQIGAMPAWQAVVPGAETSACLVVVPSADRVGRAFPLVVVEQHDRTAFDAVPLAAWHARAGALAGWLAGAAPRALPRDLDAGAAQWAATGWPDVPAGDAGTLGDLRRQWPTAGSFWWRVDDGGSEPRVQPWLPHDALVLDWLGDDDTLPPDPDGD